MTNDTRKDSADYRDLEEDKAPRTQAKDKWSNPEEALSEPPAGSPKADDQARKS